MTKIYISQATTGREPDAVKRERAVVIEGLSSRMEIAVVEPDAKGEGNDAQRRMLALAGTDWAVFASGWEKDPACRMDEADARRLGKARHFM